MRASISASRSRLRSAVTAFCGGLLVALCSFIIPISEALQGIDRQVGDQMLRWIGGPEENPDWVFLGIDDASLRLDINPELISENETLEMMSRRFPWDRRVYAETIEKLINAGARLVVLDLVLAEESDPDADKALAEVISRHREKIVLASMFAPIADDDDLVFSHIEPWEGFLGETGDETRFGYVNFRPHARDGLVRDIDFTTTLSQQNESLPALGEAVFRSLSAEIVDALGGKVPEGTRGIRFTIRDPKQLASEVYAPISIRSLYLRDDWEHRYGNGEWFRNKLVMIGPAAARFQDQHATPAGILSGPQLHMQAIASGMDGIFVKRICQFGSAHGLFLALAGSLMAAVFAFFIKRPVTAWFLSLALIAAFIGGIFLLGMASGILSGFVAWSAAFAIGTVSGQSHALLIERLERGRLHREFRRFVSRDVADALVENPEIYQLAASGRKRRVVVLFSDLRGFTKRSEKDDPAQLVGQLNEYFREMVAIVFRHGGTLDKFIGDAVMAHWGALTDYDEETMSIRAMQAAEEMQATVQQLNNAWRTRGLDDFTIGIGLHLGDVIAGELGSPEKTEFGIIGDAVNLASRLEGLTKPFRCGSLISDSVVQAAGKSHAMRRLATVCVAGRETPVTLWGASLGEESDALYSKMLRTFESGDFSATTQLAEILLENHPNDGPTIFVREICEKWMIAPPMDWDGILRMEEK